MADPLPTYTPDVVNVNSIALTIRTLESGGNYTASAQGSTASGAYQFLDSTWQGLTRRYGIGQLYVRAKDAPPQTQDQVANRYIADILAQNGNNVAAVPQIWYVGNTKTAQDMADQIPAPEAGNKLTVRQYVQKWLDSFHKLSGQGGHDVGVGDIITGGPGVIADAASATASGIWDAIQTPLEAIKAIWSAITNPDNWKHIFQVIGGGILVLVGLWILAGSFGVDLPGGIPVPKAKSQLA